MQKKNESVNALYSLQCYVYCMALAGWYQFILGTVSDYLFFYSLPIGQATLLTLTETEVIWAGNRVKIEKIFC